MLQCCKDFNHFIQTCGGAYYIVTLENNNGSYEKVSYSLQPKDQSNQVTRSRMKPTRRKSLLDPYGPSGERLMPMPAKFTCTKNPGPPRLPLRTLRDSRYGRIPDMRRRQNSRSDFEIGPALAGEPSSLR